MSSTLIVTLLEEYAAEIMYFENLRSVKSYVRRVLLKEFTCIYILFTSSLRLPTLLMRTFSYVRSNGYFTEYLKKLTTLLILLSSIIGSRTFAQDSFNYNAMLKFSRDWTVKTERAKEVKQERAKEVVQDNEYATTGFEVGIFLDNPLMLDGKPLDNGDFSLTSTGELTVIKTAPMYDGLFLSRNVSVLRLFE